MLVNLNLVDKQEAGKNLELWKKQSICLPPENRAWTRHSESLALSWPNSVSSLRGYGYSPIWTRACIVHKLWELAGRGLASEYFTPKKTKPREKKICKEKEVVIWADDLLFCGGTRLMLGTLVLDCRASVGNECPKQSR